MVKTIPTASCELPRKLSGKESTCQAGGAGLISGSGRSPGAGNGNPWQYSCLGNPWTEEPGVTQSQTQLGKRTTTTASCMELSINPKEIGPP